MIFGEKVNLPSEEPVYTGDMPSSEMELSVITYDSKSAQIEHPSGVDELAQYKKKSGVSWINVVGLKNVEAVKRIGSLYSIHPLSIEDLLDTEQQSKVETFKEYKFLSIKMIHNINNDFLFEQISLIITKNVLITFQEIHQDPFDGIRKKIMEDAGKIRRTGTDYLAYSIIDAVVDEYFLMLDMLEDDIEDFEERAIKTSDSTFIQEIQDTKKDLVKIKRAISPLKENMLMVSHHDNFFKTDELKPFLQDLNEHLNNALSIADNHREWLSNIMDVNLSVLSQQMNKVMKVLATISTIFIPLTFLAGVYGMNFQYMPELAYEYAYPLVLAGMVMIAVIMIVIFKIRRWF